MLPNRASICDFVCSRCWLRSACRAASDRRFLVGEGLKIVSANMLRSDGLENARVIDFVKHSLKIGPPDLDSEAPVEGNFAPPNAQNIVIIRFWCITNPWDNQKPCILQHSGRRAGGAVHASRGASPASSEMGRPYKEQRINKHRASILQFTDSRGQSITFGKLTLHIVQGTVADSALGGGDACK